MTKHIWGTYRPKRFDTSVRFDTHSLNGYYHPKPFLDAQYADYKEAGLTDTLQPIPEDKFNAEIVPWIKKMTRFIMWEYDETYIDELDYKNNVVKVGSDFQIEMFETPADAIIWVKDNTSLVEREPWVFVISEEYIDEMTWEIVPEKLLIID